MEQFRILPPAAKWLAIAVAVGCLAGTASATFLIALDFVTVSRETHRWLIAGLPLAGFAIGWVYHGYGRGTEAGNNLIIDEIHDPRATIPLRMAPLVLLGTLVTHLFGGSAGREGTAVQMGASLADRLTEPLWLGPADRRVLLTAGMSAGFASVFGTPLAGAVFGLEVLAIGRLRYDAIFPCFVGAITGHLVTLAWGVTHTPYAVDMGALADHLSIPGLLAALVAGGIFGVTGSLFAGATHRIAALARRYVAYPPLRPALGALPIVAVAALLGSTRYLGLGIPVIVDSLHAKVLPWDFAAKFAFTAWTLGVGFKGGEVTPLFFIGATLGNALSWILPLPTPVLAACGFAAVFAGAANVPLASTLLALELFGAGPAPYVALACVASYLCSGHAGIYRSQRLGEPKR